MKMRWFKKRPKARIKIGKTFLGEKISATAEGLLVFKEWDSSDRKNYYWEEWELRGFDDYDSWIEFDHYTRKITLYEPLKPQDYIEVADLHPNQALTFKDRRGNLHTTTIKETGMGTVVRREGALTYHVFEGDVVLYAESYATVPKYSFEKYNEKEFDIYMGRVLSRKQQKKLLGKVVSPWNWKAILMTLFFGSFFLLPLIPSYETYCTPKTRVGATTTSSTTTSIKDEKVSESSTQTCYKRRVYGGGGSGAGK